MSQQKTAYEMRISDWSSDVCSSDLPLHDDRGRIVAPAVHFRYPNAFTLKQAQHVILTAQRLPFPSGIAVAPAVHAHNNRWRFYRHVPGRALSRTRAAFDQPSPRRPHQLAQLLLDPKDRRVGTRGSLRVGVGGW